MFPRSVLQQGEAKDQPGRPQCQQEDQGERSEVAEKIFTSGLAFNAPGQLSATESRCAGKTSWMTRKVRRTRRGSTTVSNASSRIARMEKTPAMAIRACITRSGGENVSRFSASLPGSTFAEPDSLSGSSGAPGGVQNFAHDDIRFQRRRPVRRDSACDHCFQKTQRIVRTEEEPVWPQPPSLPLPSAAPAHRRDEPSARIPSGRRLPYPCDRMASSTTLVGSPVPSGT